MLDIRYEIPYLAGYSKDGKTIYVDKRIHFTFNLKDGRKMNLLKYFIVHETTEKHLEDTKDYKYPYAHEQATKAEREAVEADGYPWDEYESYSLKEVQRLKKIDRTESIPKDYDDRPERDTHDYAMLKKVSQHEKLSQTPA